MCNCEKPSDSNFWVDIFIGNHLCSRAKATMYLHARDWDYNIACADYEQDNLLVQDIVETVVDKEKRAARFNTF